MIKLLNRYSQIFTNKHQIVNINNTHSDVLISDSSVFQDTIFGYIYFYLFLLNLVPYFLLFIVGNILSFTDDTVVLFNNSDFNKFKEEVVIGDI